MMYFDDVAWSALARDCARLVAAAVLGGAIGVEREWRGRSAGLRTHVLVTLGAAAFVLTALSMDERLPRGDVLRVVQGVAIGVGFLGGGSILKLESTRRVRGLTTAAGIWNAAAIGVAAGAGYVVLAITLTIITLLVLGVLRRVEQRKRPNRPKTQKKEA